jgi:MoxR-like ATPase
MEGTYPLPEAQLDRFFFKLHIPFPSRDELHTIIDRTTTDHQIEVRSVLERDDILDMQRLARSVPVARHVQDYAIRLLQATHPNDESASEKVRRFVRTGASPRGAQAMLLAAKIRALFDGRFAPSIDDVQRVAVPALRHRILLNFEGEAEGVSPDTVIEQVLEQLPASKA